jgi:hypothetical protein
MVFLPSEFEVFVEYHKGSNILKPDKLFSVGHGSFGEVLSFFGIYAIVLSLTCIACFIAGAIWSRDGETSWRGRQLEKGTYQTNGLVH